MTGQRSQVAIIGHVERAIRRRVTAFASIGVAVLLSAVAMLPLTAAAQQVPFCAPNQDAAFRFGFGTLQQRLGPTMGTALECEHVDAQTGDTLQKTTTGLAYYQPSLNMPMFTDGSAHYGLYGGNLLFWRGDSAVLTPPSPAEAQYLTVTAPYRDRLGTMLGHLVEAQRLADAGQIEQVDGDALSLLLNDLWAAQKVFASATHPPRLDDYTRTMDMSLRQALNAGDMLVHARRSDSDTDRATLIAGARPFTAAGAQLQEQADRALSFVLPIIVNSPIGVTQQ